MDDESTEHEDAEQLLGLLVCAKRFLKWTEIQGAMSIDPDAKIVDFDGRRFRADSKDLCGSLVEIRPGGTVELVHMTAKQCVKPYGSTQPRYGANLTTNLQLPHLPKIHISREGRTRSCSSLSRVFKHALL